MRPSDTAVVIDLAGRSRSARIAAALLAVVCSSACDATTVSGLNIRAAPTTASPVVDRMSSAGSSVRIDCVTHGEAVHGQTTWYHITQPRVGYVSAYYIRTDNATATGLHSC